MIESSSVSELTVLDLNKRFRKKYFHSPDELRISDSSKRSFSKSSSSDSISGIPLLRRVGKAHARIAEHDDPHMPEI